MEYGPTDKMKGGRGLADSLTKGEDPFLKIKPIWRKSNGNVYTLDGTINRKPRNVEIVDTECRVMIA